MIDFGPDRLPPGQVAAYVAGGLLGVTAGSAERSPGPPIQRPSTSVANDRRRQRRRRLRSLT